MGGAEDGVAAAAATILSILFSMNLVLFVFNLFPVPPLDGAGALGVLLSEDTARRFQEWFASPGVALFGLLFVWWIFPRVFGPVYGLAVSFLYSGIGVS